MSDRPITKDEAHAEPKEIQRALQRLALENDCILRMLNNTADPQQMEVKHINEALNFVNAEIKKQYEERETLLYKKGRSNRNFENELRRLWQRAGICYQIFYRECVKQDFEGLVADYQEFFKSLETRLQTQVVPELKKHDAPGDDLYLLVNNLLRGVGDDDPSIDIIANGRTTPLQTKYSIFAMFGLLIQAERYQNQGLVDEAYSCLLDANNLVGMFDGARYLMDRLPAVAAKIRAKENAKKSHSQKNAIKGRAIELYYELRPKTKWESAGKAAESVWDKLVEEAIRESGNKDANPGITDSTIKRLCQKLHKIDNDDQSLNISVIVKEITDDDGEEY